MSTRQHNKSLLTFRLLVITGLVSFSSLGIAQIPPGWTPQSNGGCLKSSSYLKSLSDAQQSACAQAKYAADASSDQGACKALGGSWIKTLPQDKGACGLGR